MDRDNRNLRVEAEQLKLLIASTSSSVFAAILLWGGVFYLGHPHRTLIDWIWLAAFLVVLCVRLAQSFHFRMSPGDLQLVHARLTQFRAVIVVHSIICGLSGVTLYANHEFAYLIFLSVLIGVTAGSLVSFAADLFSSLSFFLITIGMYSAIMVHGDFDGLSSELSNIFHIGIFAIIILMVVALRRVNSNIIQNIIYKNDTKDLVDSLNEANLKLEKSESLYRTVIEVAREGVLVSQDSVLKFASPVFIELTGYSMDEIRSMPFVDLIHPDDRAKVKDSYLRRLAGENISRYRFRLAKKGGEVRWVELDGVKSTWDDRPAIFSCVTDVTDRVRIEEELDRHAKAQFEMEHRLLTIAEDRQRAIGHELHDNLGQILTASFLQSQVTIKSLQRGRIDTAIESAVSVTNQLQVAITLCRNMAHGLAPYSLDADGLCQTVRDYLYKLAFASGFNCELICDEDLLLEPNVELHLLRIVQEAATNAIRHSHGSKIAVRIEVVGEKLMVSILDDGKWRDVASGMQDESSPDAPAEGWTGIGLSLMKHRASQINGELSILRSDVGTEVRVEIRYVPFSEKDHPIGR